MATRTFTHNTNTEFEGVNVAYFTVDFINSMAAETEDPSGELFKSRFGTSKKHNWFLCKHFR